MIEFPAGALENGVATAAVVVSVMGAFSFAKWAIVRRNGKQNGNGGRSQSTLCRQHGERLAVVETTHAQLASSLSVVRETVTCMDRKMTRLLALHEGEDKQTEANRRRTTEQRYRSDG